MADAPGRFVWYELMTPDVEAAKVFYADVMGWGTTNASMPGSAYSFFTAGETRICGLLELPAGARAGGAIPFWIGFIEVNDVDAAADRVWELGGTVYVPPKDIPGRRRFSVFADRQQATVGLLKWLKVRPEPSPEPGEPVGVGWHELLAVDREAAWSFYSRLLEWRKEGAIAGPMGLYQPFSAGGQTIGAMVTKPPMVPAAFWLYYFNVGDIDAAMKRVTAGGGRTLGSPVYMQNGRWGVQCTDPQGAMFSLIGTRSPATSDKPRYDTITIYKVDFSAKS